jgi:hypothetical protein
MEHQFGISPAARRKKKSRFGLRSQGNTYERQFHVARKEVDDGTLQFVRHQQGKNR